MAKKRTFNEEDHQVNDDRDLQVRAKKRHGDPQQAEATNLSVIMTAPEVMEPIRQMIKEEFQPLKAMLQNPCCCRLRQNQECATSGGRPLQLYFENSLPQKMFTFDNLRAEDGRPLQIKLRGPEGVVMEEVGTMNLQICVLDGDFGTDGNEDWTAEEFNSQFVKPRDGRPLLKGETVIKLEKGVAFINNNIVFADNSSATRSKRFRLGVKVMQSNNFVRTHIREARSGPVRVLDRRGKEYKKKPDRPALDDEVWCLKNIKKEGRLHVQLSDNGIKSVKDLLRFNTTGLLREKFGNINGWDKIIEHAKKCELDDDERYIYHGMENSPSLIFNCIYEVVEVKFSGRNCDGSLQSLRSKEKHLVERVKQLAYKNLKDLKPIETAPHDIKTLTDTQVTPYGAPDQVLQPLLNAQQANQKDCAPSIHDEICCLKHIPKNGKTHQRLRSQGISTVKDLLQELEVETNPSSLQKKFGNISKNYRNEIIEHAKKAKDVDTCVAEATFDGWNYQSEKNIVNSDKGEAYKNLKGQVPIETITQELVKSLTQTTQHGIPNQDPQPLDFLIALQEEMEPPNWSAGGQFVAGPSHNIDDGNIWGPVDLSQIDQILTPPIDPLLFDPFPYGDGAEPSNHSSFPPDPKGKRKMV